MTTQPLGVTRSLEQPNILVRHDGVPVDATQYDDRIALHRSARHRPNSRGAQGQCTSAGCHEQAVVDRTVLTLRSLQPVWRAMCADHALKSASRYAPALAAVLHQMVTGVTRPAR